MSTAAERTLAFLEHLRIDAESDALLEAWTTALATPLERAALVAYGDDTTLPGQALRDPAVAPLWGLPAASQWTGGTMPARLAGETDQEYLARARAEVVRPRGMLRGSSTALADIARRYISGPIEDRYVNVVEAEGGDTWETLVIVLQGQTPDTVAIDAACNAPDTVVAGEHVTVRADPGWSVGQLEAAEPTVGDVEADFATVNDLETNLP